MCGARGLAAFLAVAMLAAAASAMRDDQLQAEKGSSRKLLQPFNLGIPQGGRRSGNVGNTGERRTNALSFATAGLVDTARPVNNTIRARTVSRGEFTNLDFGGAGKSSYTVRSNTTQTQASTSTGVDVRSIGAPGPGITASKAVDQSNSLAARRIKPADPQRAANDPTLGPYDGRNDNVKAGAWEVLGAGALDYGFAGDYDYSLITSLVDYANFIGTATTYDYDYGQPRAIPETGAVTTRTRTNLDSDAGRAAGFARLGTAATAYNTVARGAATTSGIWGNNAARFNDDLFGTGTVFVPPNQFRQAGAAASGVGVAKSYKGNPLPGAATNLMNAGTTVSKNYIAGGASDQLNYAQGTQAVAVRSQNVALSGEENLDFDAGRRRRLQATQHRGNNRRRRLHAARAAGQKQH